jgi:hypothetical protein
VKWPSVEVCADRCFRRLTFDMSGGPKGAKQPLGVRSMEWLGRILRFYEAQALALLEAEAASGPPNERTKRAHARAAQHRAKITPMMEERDGPG